MKTALRATPILFAIAAIVMPACDLVEIDQYPCPKGGTTLTYDNFGRTFMASWCNRCHSAEPGMRDGAPDDYVFDTLDQVRKHKDRIFARSATTNDSMPPGPVDPPLAEREKLAEWLACGAP
jgi:uncharacterized membrane protein